MPDADEAPALRRHRLDGESNFRYRDVESPAKKRGAYKKRTA